MIYEPGVSTSPILLHNVPIRDSRHCGSVHHLAPATSTPGESESAGDSDKRQRKERRNKEEEIPQCIISPSIIALCLYRGHDQLHLSTAEQKKVKKRLKKGGVML